MPALMKRPLTNITIDGKLFYIPKQEKNAILTLIMHMAEKPDNNNPFTDLEKELPKSALILRGARKKEGLSQKDLSKKTGIAVPNISKMENGGRNIGLHVAKKFARVLKVSHKIFLEDSQKS